MSKVGGRGSEVGLPAEARSAKVGGRDRLDTAIDLAVREMLDVEPPAGLRGRVIDRIEFSGSPLSTNSVASAFRRKIFWIAAPMAAAAMIILAVLAPRQSPAPASVTPPPPALAKVEPPPIVAPLASPKTPESPKTASTSIPRPVSPPAERRPSRGTDERIVVAAVALDEDADTVIDPLAPIAPIVAAGTHPPAIAPKDIVISSMAPIAQLQIAPLSPTERRN